MNADGMSQLRASHERAIKGFLQRHEAVIARCRSLLTWESPSHSTCAAAVAVAIVWIVASSVIPIVCLLSLSTAGVVVTMQYAGDDDRKSAANGPSARSRPLSVPRRSETDVQLAALASRLADGSCYIFLLWMKACQLRQCNHQAFCALTCSICFAIMTLGRVVSLATISTFLILVAFSLPLLTMYDLPMRLYFFFDDILKQSDRSSIRDYHNRGGSVELLVDAPEPPVATVFAESIDSTSSLFGSFLPNVTEMPSYDDMAATMSTSRRPIVSLRDDPTGDDIVDGSVCCVARTSVPQLDEKTMTSVAGVSQASTCMSSDGGGGKECGHAGRCASDVPVTGEAAPADRTSFSHEPSSSTAAASAADFLRHLPMAAALRAVANSVWDSASRLPTPVALWQHARERQSGVEAIDNHRAGEHSPASLAAAGSDGDDAVDYVIVTKDDALDQ